MQRNISYAWDGRPVIDIAGPDAHVPRVGDKVEVARLEGAVIFEVTVIKQIFNQGNTTEATEWFFVGLKLSVAADTTSS